jgi:peptidoglycan/LPS O-acetylase OafA/YrhL
MAGAPALPRNQDRPEAPDRGTPGSAPDAVAPPPGNPRFPLMDSVRALAAISIVLVHVVLFSGAQGAVYGRLVAHLDIGVPIFFILSGFLLYRPLVASQVLGSPAVRMRDYARRRFLRIYPAYWIALTAVAIFPGIHGIFTGNWWVYYGLLQNYPIYSPGAECATLEFCGIAPTWTLAIEVAFYAVLPFLALGLARLRRPRLSGAWLAVELGVLAVLSAVSVWIQTLDLANDLQIWLFFSPLGRAWWFCLGMGLAAVSVWTAQRREPRAVRWAGEHSGLLWAAAFLLYVGAGLFLLAPGPSLAARVGITTTEYIGEYLLFGLIAALVVTPAIFGSPGEGLPRRILASPPLAWLGLISYGIFLWHYPILVGLVRGGVIDWWPSAAFFLTALLTLALTIICATLSYYLLERPLMRLKYKRTRNAA